MTEKRKCDVSTITTLVALLEVDGSSLTCVKLARALGYQVSGRPGRVTLTKAGSCTEYASLAALHRALLRDARRLVGRR